MSKSLGFLFISRFLFTVSNPGKNAYTPTSTLYPDKKYTHQRKFNFFYLKKKKKKTRIWIDLHRIIQWMVKEDHKRGSTNHVHWKVFSVISNKFKGVAFKDFAKSSPNVYKREMLLVTQFFRKWRSSDVSLVETVWVEYKKNSIQLTVLFYH